MPTFNNERVFWQQGFKLIAGVDEVGIGALAGPVCAAAVILQRDETSALLDKGGLGWVRDSKKMTERQREKAAKWIKKKAVAWAVGEASVEEITELNILRASHLAMRRAVDGLEAQPNMLLVDGRPVQLCKNIPVVNLVKGDSLSLSIAAASVVAKVYRDGLMVELDKEYSNYGFALHKGYGSSQHKMALQKYGPTPCHRPTYAPVMRALDRN